MVCASTKARRLSNHKDQSVRNTHLLRLKVRSKLICNCSNILQGVVGPEVRQTQEDLDKIKDWVKVNSERYWLKDNGPLAARSDGGADIIIVDDPQMPELIPLAKQADPDRPVIFRCHIEVRDDLVQKEGSAAQQVWQNMWQSIKLAGEYLN